MLDLLTDSNIVVSSNQQYNEAIEQLNQMIGLPWSRKYMPKTLDEVILPSKIKDMIKFAISSNQFNNFIFFSGKPGTGKTTTAEIIPQEINADYITLYLSELGMEAIDIIRDYAMQKITNNKPRFVILDESDRPKVQDPKKFWNSLQPLIEKSSNTLRFILTCNNINFIPETITSRCTPISFAHNEDDEVKKKLFKRMKEIALLETGSVENYSVDTLKEIAKNYYPDMRAILSVMMQNYLQNCGKINGLVSESTTGDIIAEIWNKINAKDDLETRKYISGNVVDYVSLYHPLGMYIIDKIEQKHRLQFSIILGEYQYRSAQPAVDQEINMWAFIAQIIKLVS